MSDDYYFCFEEQDIYDLRLKRLVFGPFFQPANDLRLNSTVVELKTKIHAKPSIEALSAKLELDGKLNVKTLHLMQDEFEKLLLKPSSSVLEYGGYGIRFGSSNTYFLQPKSRLFTPTKAHIERLIKETRGGK